MSNNLTIRGGDMNHRTPNSKAFTLVELLTVVAIIAILIGLLFPAIRAAIMTAEKTTAKGDANQIATAVRNFYTEYGRLPSSTVGSDSTFSGGNSALISTLTGSNTTLNPKNIVFLDLPSRKNALISNNFCDPWAQSYYVKLDTDYNNSVQDPYTGINYTGVCLVISGGPDGKTSTTNDNITNFSQ